MAAKKKAAKAGAGAVATGKAIRSNDYVQRLMHDEELQENLRSAYGSARKAYSRINGKGTIKAVTDDKKTQRELRDAATALKEASDQLRGKKKKKRHPGRWLLIALVGAGLAIALSEGLRKKVLDALFGAEEEFEYTASTTSEPASPSANEPVGTS
jgi:DNA-binding transcriptional regulator PaaX